MTATAVERGKGRPLRLLILGGTTEASGLARALAGRSDVAPLLSFAGRTESPASPPIPHRVGGFGGIDGLAAFLRAEAIDAVVDATHPFAARISGSAVAACRQEGVSLAIYTRPPWTAGEGDDWHCVRDIDSAVRALAGLDQQTGHPQTPVIVSRGRSPRVEGRTLSKFCLEEERGLICSPAQPLPGHPGTRDGKERRLKVFLTTGRLELARFRSVPQHDYLIRTIDPPDSSGLPPNATVVLARPPFAVEDEVALMRDHGIDLLVTKNSGGTASAAKLSAARALTTPVLMVDRPPPSGAFELQSLVAVLAWIAGRGGRP